MLVGTNRTRRRYNQRLRELKGFAADYPAGRRQARLPQERTREGAPQRLALEGDDVVEGDDEAGHQPARALRRTTTRTGAWPRSSCSRPSSRIPKPKSRGRRRKRYDEFDYGYALTVHKAQGSQWDNVVLFDESFAFRDTRERWLYTAVTRAAERLTIVR